VILTPSFPVDLLDDSKKLPARAREELALLIKRDALAWGLGWASHAEIDALNILQATLLAMSRAVAAMPLAPAALIIDGNHAPELAYPYECRPRADAEVPEVMAASILAKTARDAWMTAYARIDPRYGFDRHKGYPTAEHRALVRSLGPCPIHRLSFRLS
jgi:ribonuclease HII